MFQATKRLLIRWGKGPKLPEVREALGDEWADSFDKVAKEAERRMPEAVEVQLGNGIKPHQSTTDPDDKKLSITMWILNAFSRRIQSIHVHEDGSWKAKAPRGEKEMGEGQV